MKLARLRQAIDACANGQPAAIATDIKTGRQGALIAGVTSGELAIEGDLRAAIEKALAEDRNTTVVTDAGPVFVEVFNPPLRCMIVGAVHIAQPLARVAALSGYAVTIIDPRSAFASVERFPGVALSTLWPDEAFEELHPDKRTAIVTLTHDPKIDDPALVAALRSTAFYIGALGSRKTHAGRCARLAEAGFDAAAIARVHGPVGLDIGAVSPAEIAVSIMAQITSVLRADKIRSKGTGPA